LASISPCHTAHHLSRRHFRLASGLHAQPPIAKGYWHTTVKPVDKPPLTQDAIADIAIIGGGFTGLNAALHLAQNGQDVAVLDAHAPVWGASGRNGGVCCLGGGILENAAITQIYGDDGRRDWRRAERSAIEHAQDLLGTHNIAADTHSHGETLLAHTPKRMKDVSAHAEQAAQDYDCSPEIIAKDALAERGMAGPFHGGVTIPLGFALNPAKYGAGLAKAATDAGAQLYANTPVQRIERGTEFILHTPHAKLRAKQILIASL